MKESNKLFCKGMTTFLLGIMFFIFGLNPLAESNSLDLINAIAVFIGAVLSFIGGIIIEKSEDL